MRSRCPTMVLGLLVGACAGGRNDSGAAQPRREPSAVTVASPTAASPTAARAREGDAAAAPRPATPALVEGPMPAGYLAFGGACASEPVVVVAAIGDVLLHHELQKQAYGAKDRFKTLWPGVADLLAAADVTYANLEVPIARGVTKDGEAEDPGLEFDNKVYTGYPFFNAHPSLAEDLVATGVDVVSTANNHALDRGSLGLERTLDALDRAKLPHTGTRRTTKESFHAVTEVAGRRIAWIACTLHTNFGKDTSGQVLHCFKPKDRAQLLAIVAELAAAKDIDAVIATPHWGKEYAAVPSDNQRELAQDLVDAGATAVLGAHPHVLQPFAKLTSKDGREAFVAYSLGNFAHHQRSLDRRSSIILYLALREVGDRLVPAGVGYVPIHVRMEGDKQKFFVEATDRVRPNADEERAHVIDMLGEPNLVSPQDALAQPSHRRLQLTRQCRAAK